jgi:hypothetical protein
MVPWFEKYKPGWGLSDAHIESPLDHLWQVTITGLDAGEALSLVDASNQELVRVTSQAGVPLRMSALVAPQKSNELTVLRHGLATSRQTAAKARSTKLSKAIHHPQDGRGIEVGQYQMLQLGSIPLNAECQSIQTTTILSKACVLTVLPEGIKAYDLSNPHRPAPIGSWSISGLRGVITWQSALLYFGEDGFGWIDGLTGQRPAPTRCCAKPIHDVTSAGRSLYAVTDEGLDVYSPGLCQMGAVAIAGARCVTRTTGKLVVGGSQGLSVHDIAEGRRPKCGPSLDGMDVKRVARPLGSEAGSVLASLNDGSAVLLNIARSEIQQTASFPQAPWFANSLRLGDLLVRIGSNGRSLEISRFAASAVV